MHQHISTQVLADLVTVDEERRSLAMTVLMTPDLANFSGNVHGGNLLKLLDQVAFTCAGRFARSYVVTLAVERVVFREPIRVGELVTFEASINYTTRSSMEVGIRVTTEDIHTGTSRHTNSCYFTMVALDENRRAVQIPQITPRNATEERRWSEAVQRRADRARDKVSH